MSNFVRPSTSDAIRRNYAEYELDKIKRERYERVLEVLELAAHSIDRACYEGREKSLALTNLEQVMFWARASIERGD